MIVTGSPQWYCLYLLVLCALGVVVAALHDRETPRAGLARVAGGLAVVALVLGTVTMVSGPEEQVNPLPSPSAGK
jgi:formate-dependent nitrite reductase membrane component NrfD